MILKQNVAVKVIVTEDFRTDLLAKLRGATKEVELGINQLEQQGQRYLLGLDRQNIQQMLAVRQEIEEEKKKQELLKSQFAEKIKEVDGLSLGQEYPQGALEGFVEINLGDDLGRKLAGQEVVIKDGIVIEIRS
ncbi:MAG: YlqD family protein [bacterium]